MCSNAMRRVTSTFYSTMYHDMSRDLIEILSLSCYANIYMYCTQHMILNEDLGIGIEVEEANWNVLCVVLSVVYVLWECSD